MDFVAIVEHDIALLMLLNTVETCIPQRYRYSPVFSRWSRFIIYASFQARIAQQLIEPEKIASRTYQCRISKGEATCSDT